MASMPHRNGSPRAALICSFLWVLVLFGGFNLGTTREQYHKTAAEFAAEDWTWTPTSALRLLRAYISESGSTLLYHTYSSVALGRRVRTRSVQPAEAWFGHFQSVHRGESPRLDERTIDRPLVPYRDYLVEYPPGFFLWTLPLACLTADAETYRLLHSLLMGFLLSSALVLCWRIARDALVEPRTAHDLACWAPLLLALVGVITVRRYDAVVSFLVCATLSACLAGRFALAGVAFGLGIASKGVPLLVAPLLLIYPGVGQQRRAVLQGAVAASVACGAVVLPALLTAGASLGETLRYQMIRPLQIESTLGALAALVGAGTVRVVHSFGSFNVVGGAADVLLGVAGPMKWGALAALYLVVWRGTRKGSSSLEPVAFLLVGTTGVFVVWMVLGRVFSAQFLTWLIPLGLLVSVRQRGAGRWLLFAALAMTQLIYPFGYHLVLRREAWMLSVVIARNLSLVAWLALVLAASLRKPVLQRAD